MFYSEARSFTFIIAHTFPQQLQRKCVDHLPVSAVLQSVAYLIFGLKQDVLELGGAGPADRQLVLEIADAIDLDVGGRVCGHCTHKGHLLKGLHAAGVKSNRVGTTSKR